MTGVTFVTGATSGIGLLVAERLSRSVPVNSLFLSGPEAIVTGRVKDRIENAQWRLADLSSLRAVHGLADDLIALDRPIDLLVLAAGQQAFDDEARTRDGFECSFAINVVANVALIDRLVAAGRTPRRVILFSSGTHDPIKKAGLPTPRHSDVRLLAYPDRDPVGRDEKPSTRGSRAYSASKLVVAMLATAYARENSQIRIDAIDPQLTPGTGLARRAPSAIRLLWHKVLPIIVPLVPFMNQPSAVADAVIALAYDEGIAAGTGRYVEVRRGRLVEGKPSMLAQDEAAQDRVLADIRSLLSDTTIV